MKLFVQQKATLIFIAVILFFAPPLAWADTPSVTSVIGGNTSVAQAVCGSSTCTLGGLISAILSLVFGIVGILAFIWALVGVFQYMTAGGNKEGLAKARGRITWVFIGLLFLIISFSLSQYIRDLFQFGSPNVPGITPIP